MTTALAVVPKEKLLSVERAVAALAECRTADEARGIRDQAEAVRVWLRAQRAGIAAQNHAAEIALRAERRMGELLSKTYLSKGGRPKKTGARGVLVSTLADLGLSKKESSRSQMLALISAVEFEARLAAVKLEQERLTRSKVLTLKVKSPGYESFDGDEYGTPREIVERARRCMGGIDLDPMSNARSQKVVRAERWISKEQNGLVVDWRGRVFLNPPYSKGLIDQAVAKAIGDFPSKLCALVNSSSDTAWFQALIATGWPFLLFRGRIAYLDGSNEPVDQNRYAQAMFFKKCEAQKIVRCFGELGQIVRLHA